MDDKPLKVNGVNRVFPYGVQKESMRRLNFRPGGKPEARMLDFGRYCIREAKERHPRNGIIQSGCLESSSW